MHSYQLMYMYIVPVKSKLKPSFLSFPPGILQAFFSCPGGREFDELSLLGGWEFDHYSQGVGNLIVSLDFMLRVALIPYGMLNRCGDKP